MRSPRASAYARDQAGTANSGSVAASAADASHERLRGALPDSHVKPPNTRIRYHGRGALRAQPPISGEGAADLVASRVGNNQFRLRVATVENAVLPKCTPE